MFKIITSLAMFFANLAAGQTTETRQISAFSKIEVSDGVEVIFTQSPQTSLKAEVSDAPGLSMLLTRNDGKTLKIGCARNMCEKIKVYVSSPDLVSIKASNESKVVFANAIDTEKFSLSLASGSAFSGMVKAEGAVNLKGESGSVFNIRIESRWLYGNFQSGTKVNLSGNGGEVAIRTSDNAFCSARNFKTDKVSIKAAGQSSVEVSVKQAIAVDISDEATVKYFGLPGKTAFSPDAVTLVNPKLSVTQN